MQSLALVVKVRLPVIYQNLRLAPYLHRLNMKEMK